MSREAELPGASARLSRVKPASRQRLSIMLSVDGMSFTTSAGAVPVSDLDPYIDAVLLNPWPVCRRLREAGPARPSEPSALPVRQAAPLFGPVEAVLDDVVGL
jgi:hypothetical protein